VGKCPKLRQNIDPCQTGLGNPVHHERERRKIKRWTDPLEILIPVVMPLGLILQAHMFSLHEMYLYASVYFFLNSNCAR
jgi:hypothetical protein